MIGKDVFLASFLLLFCLTEIGCQKVSTEIVKAVLNGSIACNFSLKYERVIDAKKLNITWYNPDNLHGISYSLDVASEKLIRNKIFWRYPSLNIYTTGYGFTSETIDSVLYTDAFLSIQEPIMLIDYSAYSGTSDPGYVDACLSLHNIGELISKFIIRMVKAGVKTKDIHCFGMSLGAQLAGNVARAFQRNYGAKLGRVTGLDPAGPCFDRASIDENLKKEDADFVDIYHFNRGKLGTVQILGHADILVNGGGPKQETCERLALLNALSPAYSMQCAHAITSIVYWKHSVRDSEPSFQAIQCKNLDEAVRQDCDGDVVDVGLDISLSVRGIFYLYFNYSLAVALSQAAIEELMHIIKG